MCMDTEEEKGEHKGSKTLFNYNYLLYFPSLILFFSFPDCNEDTGSPIGHATHEAPGRDTGAQTPENQ